MDWLKNLRAPKFYRYFFYRQYVLSKNWGNIQPAFSAMLMVSLTMLFQVAFLGIAMVIMLNTEVLDFLFLEGNPIVILGFYFLFVVFGYFLFYYNEKWVKIIKEFEGESEKQKILGKYYLFIYLFISLLGLFWCLLWYIETAVGQ